MVSRSPFASLSVSVLSISFFTKIVSSASYPTTCYVLDGQHNADAGYRCNNQTSGHSSCCAAGSLCYSNGVCQQTNEGYQDYLRVGCTDPTWKDPACLDQCTAYANSSTAGIRFCNGAITDTNQYCCDDGSKGIGSFDCCNTPSAIFAINPIATVLAQMPLSYIPTTSSSSPSTASTTSTSSKTSSPANTTSPSSSAPTIVPSQPHRTHLPLILGVTIPVAAIFIILVVLLIFRNKRIQSERKRMQIQQNSHNPVLPSDQCGPSEAEGSVPMTDANGRPYWGGQEFAGGSQHLRGSEPAEMDGKKEKKGNQALYEMPVGEAGA